MLSPLWQLVRDIHRSPLIKDMTLWLQGFGQSFDSSTPRMLGGMVVFGLLAVIILIWVMFLVLRLGLLPGPREIESGREPDHHVSALVEHG